MGLIRSTSTAAAVALAIAQGVGAAFAQTGNVCLDLESRLIQIDRGAGMAGGSNDARQYDQPVAQQRDEIDRATAEARRVGCMGGFLIFKPRADPKCGRLMATINQMRGNLQRLMNARSQAGGDPFSLARERNNILRALSSNRCGPGYAGNTVQQPMQRPGLFASLFGQPRLSSWEGDGGLFGGGQFGTYRTLCVRTCDGFYFPISFSTVPGQFDQDAQTCQQMCPGTEAVLYTHRNPGEDTTEMVSLLGEPYASLPTAFRFRTEYDKSCTCRSATASATEFTEFPTDNSSEPMTFTPAVTAIVPMPRLRPEPGEDPETLANRAGGFVPKPIVPSDETDVGGASADRQKKIRIVGLTFYYAQ